jgi:hypothetical protein
VIFAIDPGTSRSAWVRYDPDDRTVDHCIYTNETLIEELRDPASYATMPLAVGDTVLIEKIESYGMSVGEEVFTTVIWVGRFIEALDPTRVILVPRRHVKLTLCGSARAKDPNIRQALLDRFGGSAAKGTKAAPGPLYGVSADVWSALAVAVAWSEAPL